MYACFGKAAAYAGNEAVALANEGFSSPFLPGTVGVLTLFSENKLYYAYIGDSNGILISNGTMSYFTENKIEIRYNRPDLRNCTQARFMFLRINEVIIGKN